MSKQTAPCVGIPIAASPLPGEIGLPEPFAIRDFEGSLGEYIQHLYREYRIGAYAADIRLWGKPVLTGDAKASDGRDTMFWHLITTCTATSEIEPETRQLSIERCAMLPRVFPIIEMLAREDPRVCWWHILDALMITPVDFSQVVIIKPTGNGGAWRLKTSYPILTRGAAEHVLERATAAWAEPAAEIAPQPTPPVSTPRPSVEDPYRPRRRGAWRWPLGRLLPGLGLRGSAAYALLRAD